MNITHSADRSPGAGASVTVRHGRGNISLIFVEVLTVPVLLHVSHTHFGPPVCPGTQPPSPPSLPPSLGGSRARNHPGAQRISQEDIYEADMDGHFFSTDWVRTPPSTVRLCFASHSPPASPLFLFTEVYFRVT